MPPNGPRFSRREVSEAVGWMRWLASEKCPDDATGEPTLFSTFSF
jgi:hypothetical protein